MRGSQGGDPNAPRVDLRCAAESPREWSDPRGIDGIASHLRISVAQVLCEWRAGGGAVAGGLSTEAQPNSGETLELPFVGERVGGRAGVSWRCCEQHSVCEVRKGRGVEM